MQSLGLLELKGFDAAIAAWRVLGERSVASRFDEQHTQALTRLIGRDSEVAMLLERWTMARDGEGQVVLLSGEAGIGKSRISQTLRQRLSGEAFTTLLWQCSPYFANSALYPVLQQVERAAEIVATDAPLARAQKLALSWGTAGRGSESMDYLLKLLGLPGGDRVSLQQTPHEVKAHTLAALVDGVKGLAQRGVVLLLVEDAHWIDATTEELLALAIERLRQFRVLILITSRPDYAPS